MRRVLIVDDEDDIREVAKMSLEVIAGWQVLTARSGAEAIAVASSEHPDAILLDVMMPEMDGPTAFQRLGEADTTKGIPVVLLTAKAQPAELRRLEGLGVAAVLSKPFDPMALSEQVEAALGWR